MASNRFDASTRVSVQANSVEGDRESRAVNTLCCWWQWEQRTRPPINSVATSAVMQDEASATR